jgi:hypothetical protein
MTGAAVVGGLLSNCDDPMKGTWTKIEEELGQMLIKLGTKIIEENILNETSLSEKDKEGRSKLYVSVDACWNNRGSGKAYNSDSGHHLTVGNRTGKVVVLHYMSKRCVKCELETKHNKRKQHNEGNCSRHYHGAPREWSPMELSRASFNSTKKTTV